MKSSIQLLEEIIRALTAMHLKLIRHRDAGKTAIGGAPIDELIAEVDSGITNRERMLACFNAEAAVGPEPSEVPEVSSEFLESAASAKANETAPE